MNKQDDIKKIWRMMDEEKISIVMLDIKDSDSNAFKAIALLRGEDVVKRFKVLQEDISKGG